jgi:glycosyltransferase involved in cell wall biosynthesis
VARRSIVSALVHLGSPPRASVIVAARNAQDEMPALLDGLMLQSIGTDAFELILVDDASTDATAAVTAAYDFAKVIRAERRGGAYVARNLGLEQARADVLVFTDADCVPTPTWLERGLATLEETGADLVGGRIDVPLRDRPSIAELIDVGGSFDQQASIAEINAAVTANLFVRRRVFDAIGPFNAQLISGGDRELCLRATGAGFKLVYGPDAVISHAPRVTAKELARKAYRYGIGRAQMTAFGARVADRGQIWSRPGAWLPKRGPMPLGRLEPHGYEPTRWGLARMRALDWVAQRVPMAAGNAIATVRIARDRKAAGRGAAGAAQAPAADESP